jgi:hypothetical protein
MLTPSKAGGHMGPVVLVAAWWALAVSPANGREVEVAKADLEGVGPCTRAYVVEDTALRACGNHLEFWAGSRKLGKDVPLGDMSVKDARAYTNGARTLFVVDVGDESNSSLSFHAVDKDKALALGSVDWMVDGTDGSPSALPALVPNVKHGVLTFTFSKPVVVLDGKGMPVTVSKASIQVQKARIVTGR